MTPRGADLKVIAFTRYGNQAAATRHRFSQLIPLLSKSGIELTVSPLFEDDILLKKYRRSHVSVFAYFTALIRRLLKLSTVLKYDAVIIYLDLIPYFPHWIELLLKTIGVKIVSDFDDVIWVQYQKSHIPILSQLIRHKSEKIMRLSSAVVAGNPSILEYAKLRNPYSFYIPTTVDIHRFKPKDNRKDSLQRFRLGWIGSPSTASYVVSTWEVFKKFLDRHEDADLVLVGAGDLPISHPRLSIVPWSANTEVEHIQSFDVGLMPLDGSEWSKGKSGFKIIQYMSCGIPVIASPDGINQELVTPGITGWLCQHEQDWNNALEGAYSSRAALRDYGANGRKKIESGNFSIISAAAKWEEILKGI